MGMTDRQFVAYRREQLENFEKMLELVKKIPISEKPVEEPVKELAKMIEKNVKKAEADIQA